MVLRKQKMHICVVSVVEHTGRQGSYSSDGKEQHPRQFGVAGETSQWSESKSSPSKRCAHWHEQVIFGDGQFGEAFYRGYTCFYILPPSPQRRQTAAAAAAEFRGTRASSITDRYCNVIPIVGRIFWKCVCTILYFACTVFWATELARHKRVWNRAFILALQEVKI